MITLYSGTPGSGKSLHVAQKMRNHFLERKPIVANFAFKASGLRCKGYASFIAVENQYLTPEFLIWFSEEYKSRSKQKHMKEGEILLVIDECQLIFNTRAWNDNDRAGWISFFSQHRKIGYDVILVAQNFEMIDKQIRALIEYEVSHRKVKNMGIPGRIVNTVRGGNLHVGVSIYLPTKLKTGTEWFRADKKLYLLYDTYTRF